MSYTISFRLRKKAKKIAPIKKIVPIRMYVSAGRGVMIEATTPFSISPKDWSPSKKMPKQDIAELKKLASDLEHLKIFVGHRLNDFRSTGAPLNLEWLKKTIDECFNRTIPTDETIISNHVQYIIDNAATRKSPGKKTLGLSENRIKSYRTFKSTWLKFEEHIGKTVRFNDVNQALLEKFVHWNLKTKGYSVNYTGKNIDNLKAVSSDAERLEITTNPFLKKIESFKEADEDRFIITLSREETQRLKDLESLRPALQNVRDWTLIGLEVGQRLSDLIEFRQEGIRMEENLMLVDLIQIKTGKHVVSDISDPFVQDIVRTRFPYKISAQKFNEYLKEVCKKAGLNELVEGKKFDRETKRKKLGFYPKYQLVTSHCIRRSYTTEMYNQGVPMSLIKNITGHTNDREVLTYINKRENKDVQAKMMAEYKAKIHLKASDSK